MSYYDCALIPVPASQVDAYRSFSEAIANVYREYGALRIVDCLLDPETAYDEGFHAEEARDALEGIPLRDFRAAAAAEDSEVVVLSFTEWPDKAARDEGLKRALADPRVQPQEGEEVIFEGHRLIAGGFLRLFEVERAVR